MSISAKQIKQLEKIIASAQELLKNVKAGGKASGKVGKKASAPRKRRSGKELAEFRKMLAMERANGAPVAEIAAKHGVSSAYVYQLPAARKSAAKKAAAKATPKKMAGKKAPVRKGGAKKVSRKAAKAVAQGTPAAEAASSEAQS